MADVRELVNRVSDLRTRSGNEADTRFQVIDEILCSILGWDRTDFNLEPRVTEDDQEGYIDYLITTAQTSLLIEAKRVKVDFSALPNSRRAPLKGAWMKGELKKAIIQARDYGRKKGVGFCAVTNGDAWIIFPVNRRDMVSFEETYAVIFGSIESAVDTDADDFESLLSRISVIDGSLERELLGSDSNQLENRRLNKVYDSSFSKINRTTMFSSIEDEIVTAFSEELIANSPELLEKSYVETTDRIRFDDRVKMAVSRREQVISTRPMRPIGRSGVKASAERVLETRVSGQPIALLTLGLVGAGKTTFLNYVNKVSGRQYFNQETGAPAAHWLYIDFRDYSKSIDAREYIYDALFNYIGENKTLGDYNLTIKKAYEGEINALKRGPLAAMRGNDSLIEAKVAEILMKEYEQKVPYARRILQFASKSTPLFLVIDNVDQQEEVEVQERIFLEAVAVARDSSMNLVLAMRDATYVKNRTSAVFDAFTFDAIYIDSPHIQSVLRKRFAIAEHLLKGKQFEMITDGGAKATVTDASKVIEMLSSSVLGTEVGTLIEVSATGDVRLALSMTKQFLQFGYSTSYKSYLAFQSSGRYYFPVHEAIRAIMFGNQSIYRDEFSPFLNPFDAKIGRSESQFLRLYIMSALVGVASSKTFEGVEVVEIVSALEKMGFSRRITEQVITDLIGGRLCFSKSHQEFNLDSVIVPSRLCGYVVRDLISRMVFIETTIFDTFIYDDETWSRVKRLMSAIYNDRNLVSKFRNRKAVSKIFFEWVEGEMQKLCNEAAKRNLGPLWTTNPLTRVKADFEGELDRALRSAVRNYGTDVERELMGLPIAKENASLGRRRQT